MKKEIHEWNSYKSELLEEISHDPLEGYTFVGDTLEPPKVKEMVLSENEYRIARRALCGKDILLLVPPRLGHEIKKKQLARLKRRMNSKLGRK